MEPSADPKRIVREGYDRIGEAYAAWALGGTSRQRLRHVQSLVHRLPPGAAVLDLGCGPGVPTTLELARHFAVTGVDISARQLELARVNVPSATFVQADLASVEFPPASFDAVTAFYSIIHVPRREHAGLLATIERWLRPGGLLVATMGASPTESGYEENWLGAPMYWSHFDAETNRQLVEQAGLELVSVADETVEEHGAAVTFLWLTARKRGG